MAVVDVPTKYVAINGLVEVDEPIHDFVANNPPEFTVRHGSEADPRYGSVNVHVLRLGDMLFDRTLNGEF